MRNFLFTILCLITLFTNTYSQTNPGINYQAVARDASGNLLENQNISVRFSILENSPTGKTIYSETQSAKTNKYGLFTLAIGVGNPVSGNFNQIDWSKAHMFLKVDIDENDGNNYKDIGTTKFMSVPYALYGKDEDDDPTNEIQEISLSGTVLTLSKNGGSVTLPSSGSGGDNWGTQTVVSDNSLKGKGTTAEPLGISQMDASTGQVLKWNGTAWYPADNEKQTLTKDGNQIILSNDGGIVTDSVDDADSDPENELQQLSKSGDTISLSNRGGFVIDADSDPENELQALTYSNDTLRLSLGGGEAVIAKGATKLDELSDAKTDTTSVYIGDGAGYNNYLEDRYNTSIGIKSLYSNTTGNYNTAIGHSALESNTTGVDNTAVGPSALDFNTTGNNNTAVGPSALESNTTGNNNTAVGLRSLWKNTTGISNTAVGPSALESNTTGNNNTAVGHSALYSNTTGINNTAVGISALQFNTTGFNNTANGYNALQSNTTGINNTAVGRSAYLNGNYDNSTALGYGSSISNSNMARIGNSSVTSIGGYATWTNLSDGRYKFNLADDVKGIDFILKLHPVTFQMNAQGIAEFLGEDKRLDKETKSLVNTEPDDFTRKSREEKSQIRYSGFVAQEVEQAAKEVGYDFSGVDAPQNEQSLYGLRYAEFVVPLVKAVQEQQEIIQNQNQRIDELQRQIDELKNAISK